MVNTTDREPVLGPIRYHLINNIILHNVQYSLLYLFYLLIMKHACFIVFANLLDFILHFLFSFLWPLEDYFAQIEPIINQR